MKEPLNGPDTAPFITETPPTPRRNTVTQHTKYHAAETRCTKQLRRRRIHSQPPTKNPEKAPNTKNKPKNR